VVHVASHSEHYHFLTLLEHFTFAGLLSCSSSMKMFFQLNTDQLFQILVILTCIKIFIESLLFLKGIDQDNLFILNSRNDGL
jgi:hypothetical protein